MTAGASRIARFVARHRRNRILAKLATVARRYLEWHGNFDYDGVTNGEHRVLRTLAAFAPRVLVDVGANVGEWSLAAARLCPSATVHAFEVSPITFETLAANTAGEPRITCHAAGLGESAGEVKLRHYDSAPALTTASGYPHALPFREIVARVAAGDEEAARLGIGHIDLLKIDVEGMEEQVLRGFGRLLASRSIDLVQFEYGRVNILNGFLLHRCGAFFAERGYAMGKIYPDYVDFREPALEDEDFLGPNYLACRADRGDLLAALGGRPG
ncbi:MAG TPA: FkbM family methyltransferase [Usitatibacter sp.]|nr:FkbM family methyltransferase [Usitatibacter sp.]